MRVNLKDLSTQLLGEGIELALNKTRKKKYFYDCILCGKLHSGAIHCEFCLADELYSRRKTMQFMTLSLTVQAAVCLIAKNSESCRTGASLESQVEAYAQVPKLNEITKLSIGDDNAKD